jgi:hypothetical protein
LEAAENGYYYLVSKKSSKVAAVNGDNIVLYDKIPTAEDQKWILENAEDGYFYIVNKKSSKLLDVYGSGKESGVNVQQYSKNSTDSQKWGFEDV